jgi:alpha-tubulin suppressor-like RCC1 family protein
MAFTKISTTNIQPNTVVDYATYSAFTIALAPKISSINIANSTFTVLDDTAVNVGGGYIVVTGTNFISGATVLIDTTAASAVTYVNSTTLRVQVPTKSAATYNLYVVNPDGGTGIRVNGITYSAEPNWVTTSPLTSGVSNTAFSISLSATSGTSYALAAGSTLPAGTALLANGYFYGTVSVEAETAYSFSVVATDAENQEASKTFSFTIGLPYKKLYTWGENDTGQLGSNSVTLRSSPAQVGTGTNWTTLASNSWTAPLMTKADGTLWTWGYNGFGNLGLSDTTNRSSPVQLGALSTWSNVAVGIFGAGAIKTDGTLWLWGRNNYGQLGINNIDSPSTAQSPIQVGALTNWSKITMAKYVVLAIKTNGTLWAWGDSSVAANHGLNISTKVSSPTQVGTDTNWSLVCSRFYSTAAIKTDGTLWAWGYNSVGNLGLNSAGVHRSSPVQVGALSNWSKVNIGAQSVCAIKTDGTLWMWGNNNNGQLGLNDRVTKSSPTQIGTDTNWSLVNTDAYSTIALKTNGTLWMWGFNDRGQLGFNDAVNRSSPTQIGTGTNWGNISISEKGAIAITSS